VTASHLIVGCKWRPATAGK